MCFESGADHTEGVCRRQSSLGRVGKVFWTLPEAAEGHDDIINAVYYQLLSD
jgi:hypothetical protein